MNKSYFCRNFFLIDWSHKRLKNTIDLLLFYGEHFHGFSESVLLFLSHSLCLSLYLSLSLSSMNFIIKSYFITHIKRDVTISSLLRLLWKVWIWYWCRNKIENYITSMENNKVFIKKYISTRTGCSCNLCIARKKEL